MDGNDRSKRVLAALVRQYIATGEPIASSVLVTAAGLGVSSATVRHLLPGSRTKATCSQPHTSAGRVPTDRGYRFYVDLLLEQKRPRACGDAGSRPGCGATAPASTDRFAASAGLARAVRRRRAASGLPFGPANEAAVFDRVEFVPLSSARVLVVIVARGGHVIQKVIDVGESLQADDLRQAANYLNAEFSGMPLNRAREAVLERINEERLLYDALLARAMRLATSTFSDLPERTGDLRRGRGVARRSPPGAHARDAARAACR